MNTKPMYPLASGDPSHGGPGSGLRAAGRQPGRPADHPAPGDGSRRTGAGRGRPRRSLGKILAITLAVLAVVLLLAEFGMRWYMRDQIISSVKNSAAESGAHIEADPEVKFGTSPVLLGMAQGTIPHLDLNLPSTLNISYVDNDKSKPVVQGNPAVHITGTDLKPQKGSSNATFGELDVNTTIPPDLMLAEVRKSTTNSPAAEASPVAKLITISGVRPNPQDQSLDFEISGGIAQLRMKPVVRGGQMQFEVQGAKIFGFNVPESFTSRLRDSLASAAGQTDVPEGLQFTSAKVVDGGLELTLHGTDVDMKRMTDSLKAQQGTQALGRGQPTAQPDSLRPAA
ncbi:LmeA family phospholipid-binding protein [Corynebacterium heidelbergense]|uniref:DUF2993 domain-containing protein n=1 Tax=Corynebacterium heidelbergense TaxID=2055947 RepID=A0A364V8K0_9CORY|nr:DUF2993 domain-containing protein [Corynebacterium heidelbergense]RAV32947.1 DUF2993 domain-containing protein [Corynebacterium heidelbergense]